MAHEARCRIEVAVPRRPWRGPRAGGHPRVGLLMRRLLWLGAATVVLCGVTMLWQARAARRGADARAGPAGSPPGRRSTATSGPTTRRASRFLLAGLVKLFGPSLLTWRLLRLAIDVAVALLAYRPRAPPRERGLGAAGLARGGGRDGVPDRARPERDGAGAGARRDRPGAAQRARARAALAGLACFFRPEIGVACVGGAMIDSDERLRVAVSAFVVAAVSLAPFLIAERRRHAVPDGRVRRRAAPAAPAVPIRPARRAATPTNCSSSGCR